jgi:hypothetical protein
VENNHVGGAIYGEVGGGAELIISDTRKESGVTFDNCRDVDGVGIDVVGGYGGAIGLRVSDTMGRIMLRGSKFSFNGCSAIHGNHIFIEAEKPKTTMAITYFNYDDDLMDDNNLVGTAWNDPTSSFTPLRDFICQSKPPIILWMDNSVGCKGFFF